MNLLDCTLRDGGYYNEWDFSRELVTKYLRSVTEAGIPVVELGFRVLSPTGYLGPTAHTTDVYLEDIDPPSGPLLGVMVNAKELVQNPEGPERAIDTLFCPAIDSRLDLVRIASTWDEVASLLPAALRLRELGYTLGINLMQVHRLSPVQLAEFGGWCRSADAEVAYFADSFGALHPEDIAGVTSAVKDGFQGPVGCHMHDNMGMAMANTLAAVDAGATWVDGTIRGMGRGPGNARTEYLVVELAQRGLAAVDIQPIATLVANDFQELHERYKWGTNLLYVLSAVHGVHPTYVQRMMSDPRWAPEDIVPAIEQLGRHGGNTFSLDRAVELSALSDDSSSGQWDASDWCEARAVLLVGPGESVVQRRGDIENFVRHTSPIVLNMNLMPLIEPSLIDAYVVCNPLRAKLDSEHLPRDTTPVIGPRNAVAEVLAVDGSRPIRDYGIRIQAGELTISPTECRVPHGNVAAYAIAVAWQGGARAIGLVGFDGFEVTDPRQAQMIEVFELFSASGSRPSLVSLTPTTYPIRASSFYAPEPL